MHLVKKKNGNNNSKIRVGICNESIVFSHPCPQSQLSFAVATPCFGASSVECFMQIFFDWLLGKTSKADNWLFSQPFKERKKIFLNSNILKIFCIKFFTKIDPNIPARVLVYFLHLLYYFIKFQQLESPISIFWSFKFENLIAKCNYGSTRKILAKHVIVFVVEY